MNWQKFFITFIVLYIVTSVLGFLIHGLWLSSQYEQLSGVWRGDMDKFMWVQYVTGAFYCFFFVFIFARGQENKGIMEGIRYGLIIWGFYICYLPNLHHFHLKPDRKGAMKYNCLKKDHNMS